MHDFPHHYRAIVTGELEGDVKLESAHLPTIVSAPPEEFDGPGNQWSPETMLTAAIGDCLILTFRAIAKASGLSWISLTCDVEGIVDRVERVIQFTEFRINAKLCVPQTTDETRAYKLLEKAEHNCLISNSLKAKLYLEAVIERVAD